MLLTGCKQFGSMSDPMAGKTVGEERHIAIGRDTDLEFRWIPAGRSVMGRPPDEQGRRNDEDQKQVKVTEGYWIAATETTMATWQKVMGKPLKLDSSAAMKPVVRVSWHDCREFLNRLKTPAAGWKFELPTEVQWEHACRAGSKTPYSGKPADHGWLEMNSGGARQPIGMKKPSAWSVRDMHGNIAEWCRDSVKPDRTEFAIRGGSWESDINSRAAARNSDTPFLRINRVGFRLVLIRDDGAAAASVRSVCKKDSPTQP